MYFVCTSRRIMKIIGLCGGSGSGKGTVCKAFLKHGIPSVDADAVYREIAVPGSPVLSDLAEEFGQGIINADGSLNRAALAKTVFGEGAEKCAKQRLDEITLARIIEEAEKRFLSLSEQYEFAIFDAPLLFESGFDRKCDIIIAVIADTEIRISRIMSRDGISRESAEARIISQIPDDVIASRADYTILNNGSIAEIDSAVSDVVSRIKNNL